MKFPLICILEGDYLLQNPIHLTFLKYTLPMIHLGIYHSGSRSFNCSWGGKGVLIRVVSSVVNALRLMSELGM